MFFPFQTKPTQLTNDLDRLRSTNRAWFILQSYMSLILCNIISTLLFYVANKRFVGYWCHFEILNSAYLFLLTTFTVYDSYLLAYMIGLLVMAGFWAFEALQELWRASLSFYYNIYKYVINIIYNMYVKC